MGRLEIQIAERIVKQLTQPIDAWQEIAARHEFVPYGATAEAYWSEAPELLLSGPAGTGKSRAILEKIHRAMLDYPGTRALIMRKTRHSLSETTLVTFEEKVLGEDHPLLLGIGGRRLDRTHRTHYQYPNGSRIVLGGMDRPTKVFSSEYDIIYVPEAVELTLTDWETLITRKRNGRMPYQQLIADTNPDSERHWLYQRCIDGLTRILFSTHEDNPMLYDRERGEWTAAGRDYVLGVLENLTGVRKKRLRFGKWVTAEGAVYEEWDPAIHLIDKFEIPRNWRRFRVVDFGYNNPFVCQWWAMDRDDRLYLYREIYMTGRTVKQHTGEIKRLTAGLEREAWNNLSKDQQNEALAAGENIEATWCDHDAEDRATLEENGIKTKAAIKWLRTGIEKVQERLAPSGDGKPRLFVLRDSLVERDRTLEEKALPVSTIDEFPGYVYPAGQDGKPVKEEPVDLNNHGMDCVRYMVATIDKAGKPRSRKIRARNLWQN